MNHAAKCFGQKEVLVKTVRLFNEAHNVRHTNSFPEAEVAPHEMPPTKHTPTDPLAKKLQQHIENDEGKNKFVRMWQHLISQSNAPVSRGLGLLGK